MKQWKKASLAAAVAAACLMTGCGGRQETARKTIQIGVVAYSEDDTFIGELLGCLKEDVRTMEVADADLALTIRYGAGQQRTQDKYVQELIDGGCDVLCVNLVDRTAPTKIINLAMEQDIPVVFFNREPVKEDILRWDKLYYVGCDAKESGVMEGQLAAERIRSDATVDRNHDGVIQYILFEGEPNHQDAIIRTENVVSTLVEEGIQLEKLSYQIANWSRAQAQTKMSQMIQQYGSKIEVVLANNDDMALGALDAYDRSTITDTDKPVIFGIDGTEVGLKAVEEGKLAATVYNDKEGQAKEIAELAVALARGEELTGFDLQDERYMYLPYRKVTADNFTD